MSRIDFNPAWADAFWARVDRRTEVECWPWIGTINWQRRPSWGTGGQSQPRRVNATRFSFWLANGSISEGKVICHRCDNSVCVNPYHLFEGTQAENLADMTSKGRRARCGLKGESHPNAKLTDQQAQDISRLIGEGAGLTALALEYGVDRTTIYRAAKRAAA